MYPQSVNQPSRSYVVMGQNEEAEAGMMEQGVASHRGFVNVRC